MARGYAGGIQGRRHRQADHRLTDVIGRIGLQLEAEFVALGSRCLGPDQQAVPARFAHRLDHQLVEAVEGVVEPLLLAADEGLDIGQDGVLVQVIADDARHVGIDRLVVGDPGPRRVGQRHMAGAIGAHQARHAEQTVGAEHFGIDELVIETAIDGVDALEPAGGPHIDLVVFVDQQVGSHHQRHAHLARQEDMLEEGRIIDAGRQQHDLRIAFGPGRHRRHGGVQADAVIVHRTYPQIGHQIGEGPHHQGAVLDHVGDARRRAGIVLQHAEDAGLVADQIDAGDMGIGAVGDVDALHLGPVIGIAQHQLGRHDAVLQDLLIVIDVVQEQIDRLHPLDHPGLDRLPFVRGDHARDHVKGQDAVDRIAFGIDREGDAEIEQLALGVGGAARQIGEIQGPETGQHGGDLGLVACPLTGQFTEERSAVIACHQSADTALSHASSCAEPSGSD